MEHGYKKQGTQNSNFIKLIRSIWLLSSDFLISDEEIENRAAEWNWIIGDELFLKYEKYIQYILRQCCRERSFRGAIHANEFYRMFCRVIKEQQVYSFRNKEWISETEAMELILNSNRLIGDCFRESEENRNQQGIDAALDQCRAIIYGWECEQ